MTNRSDRAFQKDCLEILSAKVARGELTRRRFTQIAGPFFGNSGSMQHFRDSQA